jgi:hypothetical protein
MCNNTIGKSMDVNVRMKIQFALNFALVPTSFYTTRNKKGHIYNISYLIKYMKGEK